MKVIIAGSRSIQDKDIVRKAIKDFPEEINEVVCGGCRGPDQIGKEWAEENDIDVKVFEPNWGEYGKAAGPIRNRKMAKYANALVAIWDGESSGTKNMIKQAKSKCSGPIHVKEVR